MVAAPGIAVRLLTFGRTDQERRQTGRRIEATVMPLAPRIAAAVTVGTVALVFAGFAIAAKIFTPQLYVVVLMVVMATTMVTPPLLKVSLARGDRRKVASTKESQRVPFAH